MSRREFLIGVLAAPAIVRTSSLMPKLILPDTGVWMPPDGFAERAFWSGRNLGKPYANLCLNTIFYTKEKNT